MRPNSGTFKKGRGSATKQPIGAVRIRTDKTGNPRAWVKIADNGNPGDWKHRAVLVWERTNGRLPRGMVVHHKDRDSLNDDPSNLQAMTRAEHLEEHRGEFREKRTTATINSAGE